MYTISELAAKYGLSRSTLLYYERIGLLAAPVRERNNYRLYTENDAARLEQICTYRQAGLKLSDIRNIMASETRGLSALLEKRLAELNSEVAALREQQRRIISLLQQPEILEQHPDGIDKYRWVGLMKNAGFTDADMLCWHRDFERQTPTAHQQFLEQLGLSPKDVAEIRRWSRNDEPAGADSA